MKPTLFLIGMILSALGITMGIFYDTHWFILLFIGLILILIKGTTNTNKFCIEFAKWYHIKMLQSDKIYTTKELLNKFKNEYYEL